MDEIYEKGVTFMLIRDGIENAKLRDCIHYEINPNITPNTRVINLGSMKLDLSDFKKEYEEEIDSYEMMCCMLKFQLDKYNDPTLFTYAKTWKLYVICQSDNKITQIDITEKFRENMNLLGVK